MTLEKIISDLEKEQKEIRTQLECIDKYKRSDNAEIYLDFRQGDIPLKRSEIKDFLFWKQGELGRKNKNIKNLLNDIKSLIIDNDKHSSTLLNILGIDAYKYLIKDAS